MVRCWGVKASLRVGEMSDYQGGGREDLESQAERNLGSLRERDQGSQKAEMSRSSPTPAEEARLYAERNRSSCQV